MEVRERYPDYQIAIIYVMAREEVVFERVRRRAEETGRSVPEAEVRDSLTRVPQSVKLLSPHADFYAQAPLSSRAHPNSPSL